MDNKKLTPKQKAFADYYIELGNATQSAIKAGYSKRYANTNANKLLQNTTISYYIDERLKLIEDARIAKGEEVLQYLTKVMRGEEKDQFGLDASLQDRTKAAELLGKRYRLFVDKVE
ncbi:MAG: terminase small subunit, partial [Bacilli bacterium]